MEKRLSRIYTSLRLLWAVAFLSTTVACVRSQATAVVPASAEGADASPPTAAIDLTTLGALVEVAVAGTLTQSAVEAAGGPASTATEAPDIYGPGTTWTGELPFNNLQLKYGTPHPWGEIIERLISDYAKKAELRGANSLLTSLTNPRQRDNDRFDPEPETEPGLAHTDQDMARYQDVATIVTGRYDARINELGYYNPDTGLWTVGIYGPTHDKDAITFFTAMGLAAAREPGRFISQGQFMTLRQVMEDADLVAQIVRIQDEIYRQTQDAFLGLSPAEVARREAGADASAQIPARAQKDDQIQTCDDFMASAGSRVDQPQSNRLVQHVSGGRDVFVEANVDTEGILVTAIYDAKTGEWDTDAFTDRAYEGEVEGQEGSASGEQERPCGAAIPLPSFVPITPGAVLPPLPTRTPVVVVPPLMVVPPSPPLPIAPSPFPSPVAPPPPPVVATSTLVPPATEDIPTATQPAQEASPQGEEVTATAGEPTNRETSTQPPTAADTQAPNQQPPATPVPPPTQSVPPTSGFGG